MRNCLGCRHMRRQRKGGAVLTCSLMATPYILYPQIEPYPPDCPQIKRKRRRYLKSVGGEK